MMFFRLIISTIIFTLSITALCGQETKITADSLFENQKFTEAFELYDSLYQSGQTSKSILLKMAYIKEGLGDYTNSLIYLNKYYELTTDRKTFDKMTELAKNNDLSGYEYSDNRLFISFFRNYRSSIILFLLLLITLCTATIIYQKNKNKNSVGAISVQVILTICLISVTTDLLLNNEAVIFKDQTIVMSGPSAGSEPLLVLKKGHKVEVVKQDQLWVKIRWDNQEAWVRNQQLTFL